MPAVAASIMNGRIIVVLIGIPVAVAVNLKSEVADALQPASTVRCHHACEKFAQYPCASVIDHVLCAAGHGLGLRRGPTKSSLASWD